MSDTLQPDPVALVKALQAVLSEVSQPDLVLRTVLEQAVRLTGAERGVFVEVGEKGGLEFGVLHHVTPAELDGPAGAFSRSIFAEVLRLGEPVLLDNALKTPGLGDARSIQDLKMVSILCLPVRAGGRVAGLVHLEHSRPGRFGAEQRALCAALLEVASPVLEALQSARRRLDERDRLRDAERRARVEIEESRGVLARDWSFGRFVGRSPAVRALEEQVRRAASAGWPALITGETGTGKGIVARILHHAGPRSAKPFVTVFCPSLERGLVESELFGHRKGAFTGAETDRPGKVPAAEGGTLFLDEIGELPIELQPKILRLLQEKTYERLGEAVERRADVRVIAATNRDLESEIGAGRFRRDLYERLNFLPVAVPPLRERQADVPALLRHALDESAGGRWVEIDAQAERWLAELDFMWPGNVRHVEQLAARLSVEGLERPATRDDLARLLGAGASGNAAAAGSSPSLDEGLPALLEKAEREWLARALAEYPSLTRRELAGKLKISEPTLYKKLKEHGLGGAG